MSSEGVAWWQDKLPQMTGHLIKQGGFRGGSKTWKRRYCVLQGGDLLYYNEDTYRGAVPVRGARIEVRPAECKGREHGFAIRHETRTFFACAESGAELSSWLTALHRCAGDEPEVPDVGATVVKLGRVAGASKRRPPTKGARKPPPYAPEAID